MFDKYDEVLQIVKVIAEEAAKELDLRVSLDEAIFTEAFLSAKVSCAFHGRGDPNHIKKATHLGFWVIKLKPFSLSPRFKTKIAAKTGIESIIENIDAAYKERLMNAMKSPINEVIGLSLIDDLIMKGYNQIANKLDSVQRGDQEKSDREDFDGQIVAIEHRYDRIFDDLVLSFREHNYSARGLAMMFCAIYSTGFESQH
jgi:hypothetical protein